MKAVDETIDLIDQRSTFLNTCRNVFSISGRETVVTGRVESGTIKVGEEIEIVGIRDTKNLFVLVLKCLKTFR